MALAGKSGQISARIAFASGARAVFFASAALLFALLALPLPAGAQLIDPMQNLGQRPELLKDVGIDQKLNDEIPLDLTFRDEHGKTVELAQFFGSKPVILTLVYYNCPMLCTQVLNGLDRTLKQLPMDIGKDFNVVTVSIDPTERPVLAEAKQAMYTGMYGRPGAADGWRFLTGDEPQIKRLAQAVGFRYAYDSESKQFAHASVIMMLTPEGRLSRYFYGIQYPARDIRLGLEEASQGKISSPVDQILLFCYHFDPHSAKYTPYAMGLLRLAGAATVLMLGGFVFISLRRERREKGSRAA